MAIKKACGCMSTRMGTLVFLYYFLIAYVWEFISLFTGSKDPIFKEFLKANAKIYYAEMFISLIGCLILLATVISITNNSPSIILLNSVSAFLILSTIFSIYLAFYYTSNGVFDELFDSVIDKESQKLSEYTRDQYRTEMKNLSATMLKIMYFLVAIDVVIVIYAILVFHGYKTDLKENPIGAPAPRNVNDKEANFSKPSAYNLQFTASQYSAQPPQYPSQPPQYPSQASQFSVPR